MCWALSWSKLFCLIAPPNSELNTTCCDSPAYLAPPQKSEYPPKSLSAPNLLCDRHLGSDNCTCLLHSCCPHSPCLHLTCQKGSHYSAILGAGIESPLGCRRPSCIAGPTRRSQRQAHTSSRGRATTETDSSWYLMSCMRTADAPRSTRMD